MATPNTELAGYLDFIGTAIQNVRDAEIAQKEVAAANEKSSMKVLDAVTAQQEAEKLLELEKANATKRVEDQKQRIRTAAGGEEALVNQVKKVHDSTQKVQELTNEVTRIRSRNILDIFSDPVGVLTDIATMRTKQSQLTNEVANTATLVNTAKARHETLTYGFAEAENTKSTVTAASLAAITAKHDAMKAELAAKAEITSRSFGLQAVQAGLQATESQLKYLGDARNAVKLEQQMDLQRKQFQLSVEASRRDAVRLEMALRAEARDAAKQAEADAEIQQYGKWLAVGAGVMGITMATDMTSIKNALRRAQNPKSVEAKMLELGMANSSTPGGSKLASNPSDALELVKNYPVQANEQMKYALTVLSKAEAALGKNPQLNKKKDPEAWNTAFDAEVKKQLSADMANPANIPELKLGPVLGTVIEGSPALQNLAFTQRVLKPLMQTNQLPTDDLALIKLGVEEVRKRNITSDQLLTGLTQLYTQGVNIRNQALRISDFGMVPEKGGITYRVNVPKGAWGTEQYDMTKSDDVRKAIQDLLNPRPTIGNPFLQVGTAVVRSGFNKDK